MKDRTHAPPRATIADVARRAGVSIKTVSRVVNEEPNVATPTRAKVHRAIADLAYRPNTAARRLAGQRSFLIALLYEDPSAHYNATANYAANLQGGALKVARRTGHDLLIHPCSYREPDLAEEIRLLADHQRLDGVLIAPPLAEVREVVEQLRGMGIPVVRIAPGDVHALDAVHTNDREIAAAMTGHLAGLGHRRIAFISGHPDHRAMANRTLGYRDGLRRAGLAVSRSLVVAGDNSFDSGVACARRLLARKRRPTAIFAANDDMAAGVLHAALEQGVAVPGELSVAGFDDVPLSRQVWPTLTTVHQPVLEMAEQAAALLLRQMAGEPLQRATPVESRLVIRQSTGPAPA